MSAIPAPSTKTALRELLFKQAQLYRGVTREQFERDRAGSLFPRDSVAASIARQNDAEKAAHEAKFRPIASVAA